MAEIGRSVGNTIAKAQITFAMVETADSADCNSRKNTWLGYGFKDVTPDFGSQATVPSLNGSQVAAGRTMLEKMAAIDADWFMLSGHHGAIYASDYTLLSGGSSKLDFDAIMNNEDFCGFFNESYHEGRWDHASRSDPDASSNPPKTGNMTDLMTNEIYLRTTAAATSPIASHVQDNPMVDRASGASAPTPKGIILSACNTLIYKSARTFWNTNFPNAVIFGPVSRIASGTWVTNAIASAAMTNEAFWRDPQSILDQSGMCEKLEKQITAGFPSSSKIGLMYKGTLYIPGKSQSATDSLALADVT
jgi:hypothetical protein